MGVTHTFSSNGNSYDVYKLMELVAEANLPVTEVPVSDLEENLDHACWSDEKGDPEMLNPNFSPREVLERHDQDAKYKHHYERAMLADLQYAIMLLPGGRGVADGMHRLLKTHVLGLPTIRTVQLTDELMEQARVQR